MNVFANISFSSENSGKTDTTSLVQKPYLKNIYFASNIEQDIDMKIFPFRIKILQDPLSIREPAWKLYVVNKINNSSKIKKTLHTMTLMIKI